jgi:glycosyltransferase involved in cell wall biosynthesis
VRTAMKISIIINVLNGEKTLRYCLDSALSQTFDNFEVVVFDNGSTDRTAEICADFKDLIKYVKRNNTVTLYKARNLAVDEAEGDYIAFMDCDDWWDKQKLKKQAVIAAKHPTDIIYCGYSIVVGTPNEFKVMKSIEPYKSIDITSRLLLGNRVSIGTCLIPRVYFEREKFNPDYNLLGDFEFWVRASMQLKFRGVSEYLEYSRLHDSNLSKKLSSNWITERLSFIKTYKKNFKGMNLLALFFYQAKTYLKYVLRR